jgi:pyrophosphatase PpaX
MPIRAILFDLDGTLGDTLPVVVQALQETFARFAGQHYTPLEINAMFGPAEEGVIRPRVAPEQYEAALRHYLERYAELHAAASQPFPGVLELLDRLRALGLRVGIVTGKGAGTARISMQAMGLDGRVERLAAGSPNGAEKPAAIRAMLVEWGVAPAEAAYVGDMPYDMAAAREAGVLPLGAAWAGTATVSAEDGARLFKSVAELAAWVEETQRGGAGGTGG